MGIFGNKKSTPEIKELRKTARELGIEMFETEIVKGIRDYPRKDFGTIITEAKQRALKRAREVI